MRAAGVVVTTAAVLALATGCGAGSRQVSAPAAAAHATSTPAGYPQSAGCPTPTTLTEVPKDVPSIVPIPAGGQLLSDTTTADGLRVVRFSIPTSLRQGVLFILDRYPKAGFVLARGDAEADEVDAPFASKSGTLRGALRLTVAQPCSTTWILALARTGTAAAIPSYTPSNRATPPPFS